MTQAVWRIAADTPGYVADDLSGAGAKATGGRWNEKGAALTYASQTRALACLETIVHLNAGGLPLNRYLVRIDIPDPVWAAARRETAASLAVGWDAQPSGRVSIQLGARWIASRATAVLLAPSVVVPEEYNVLINPAHPDSAAISATKVRRWLYDPRLVK